MSKNWHRQTFQQVPASTNSGLANCVSRALFLSALEIATGYAATQQRSIGATWSKALPDNEPTLLEQVEGEPAAVRAACAAADRRASVSNPIRLEFAQQFFRVDAQARSLGQHRVTRVDREQRALQQGA